MSGNAGGNGGGNGPDGHLHSGVLELERGTDVTFRLTNSYGTAQLWAAMGAAPDTRGPALVTAKAEAKTHVWPTPEEGRLYITVKCGVDNESFDFLTKMDATFQVPSP
ncbi:MAG: hypothetical protein RIT81_25325 [Deltaproteobacteria bacterium]